MTAPVLGTTPYPWPFDGHLVPERTALLVCGAGTHWSGRTPLDEAVEANLAALRGRAAELGIVTVLVSHLAPDARPVALPEGPVCPPLAARDGDVVVTAAGLDGFYGSPLDPLLQRAGRDQLLVAGRGLETTVHSTLRRANDRGYECLVVADACAVIDPDLRHASLSSIEMSGGIFGAVGTTAAVLTALDPSPSNRLENP